MRPNPTTMLASVALAPKADPADVGSPEAIVRALHEALNGSEGPWNSDRFRSLCAPNVREVSVDRNDKGETVLTNHTLAGFIRAVQEVHRTSGWYEYVTKIDHVSTVFKQGGGLAVVDYEGVGSTTPHGTPVEQGEVLASLMFDGHRWWVVADTW